MAELELQESVIHINRVAKVVKGGRNFAFTALVAVGDGNGKAGIGYGKGREVPLAIQKAIEDAKKNIQDIPMAGSTIVHSIIGKHGSNTPIPLSQESHPISENLNHCLFPPPEIIIDNLSFKQLITS